MARGTAKTDQPVANRKLRIALLLLGVAAVLVVLAIFVVKPQRVAGLLLSRIGAASGLELSATGAVGYQLRGTPTVILHNVVAREPGASAALLHADRILLSLPWATVRARGAVLDASRLELDGATLDLPALQHWLATRPPSTTTRLPTLAKGLRIRDSYIRNDNWDIDGIQVDVAKFAPESPLHARLRGRYLDPPLQIPVDLNVAILRPAALVAAADTGFATTGRIVVQRGTDWRLPATVTLSGPLSLGDDELRITPAKLGVAGTYESGASRIPFAVGIHGSLLFDEAVWLLAPAQVVVHGRGEPGTDPVPALKAEGNLALGRRLVLRLQGKLDQWPAAWPALPAPLSDSRTPLPFALDYTGTPDLTGIAAMQLQPGAATLDVRLRVQDLQAWLANDASIPLPPLDASLHAPRLEIAGAKLHGVEVTLFDPSLIDDAGNDDAGSDAKR